MTGGHDSQAASLLSPRELAAMFERAHERHAKDAWTLACLAETGFRAAEMCALDVASFDVARGTLTLARGSQPRIVPIHASAPALLDLLDAHPLRALVAPRADLAVPLLWSDRPGARNSAIARATADARARRLGRAPIEPLTQPDLEAVRLTEDGLVGIVKRVALRASIRRAVTPNVFRQSVATLVLASGQRDRMYLRSLFGFAPPQPVLDAYARLHGPWGEATLFRALGREVVALT